MTQTAHDRVDGRTARRTQTRARILTAAAGLMADRGITGTTIDDVAAQAGVAKGSVFYNFGSKDALCRAVVQGGVDQIVDAIATARDGHRGWDALDAVSLAMLSVFDTSPDLGQVLATEMFRRGRPWENELPALRRSLLSPLVEILREVHADRRASGATRLEPDDEHFESVAVSYLGALLFGAFDRSAYAPGRSLDALHRALMQTVSGLRD